MSILERVAKRAAGGIAAHISPEVTEADPLALADVARRQGRFADAAAAYKSALAADPNNADLLIQRGHMHKEAGQFGEAKVAYERALALTPQDPDLLLQLGHFYKVSGKYAFAELAYQQALQANPDNPEPAVELDGMYRSGWRKHRRDEDGKVRIWNTETGLLSDVQIKLLPQLQPRSEQELLYAHHESIDVRRLGCLEPTIWGDLRVLRGVEAIRGYCSSASPIRELQVKVNGLLIFKGPIEGFPFKMEANRPELRKWVFNVWLDFSGFEVGKYEMELSFHEVSGPARTWRETIVIAEVTDDRELRSSDAFVPPFDASDDRLVESQINALPSVIRPAKRPVFENPIRNIAVLRTDQLGDLVLSISALKRLRELCPQARLVGLLTTGNADLARTLGLFDEIIVIEFPDVRPERRRVMTLAHQKALRDALAPYEFDIAIDMSESSVSRPLLLLTGARFTYGFRDREFAWMSAGFECNTRDAKNRLERVPHSAKVLGLIETLGALLDTRPEVIRRSDLDRTRLERPFGIRATERYAVLHAGARLEYSRWPGYAELAQMLLDRTDLKVVMMTDSPQEKEGLNEHLRRAPRFQLIDGKIDFNDFDALLSFCAVFVGNDSGPKHMASLRGAPVVSLQMARNNWSEWGQENTGVIVSRRVPCAGCVIQHDPEECGKDYACIRHIKAEEVFGAVEALL